MASEKDDIKDIINKLQEDEFLKKFPGKIDELKGLLEKNKEVLKDISSVLNAKTSTQALLELNYNAVDAEAEDLVNFFQNFDNGKIFTASLIEYLNKAEILKDKQQKEAAEEAARFAADAFNVAEQMRQSKKKGTELPLDAIEKLLEHIPGLKAVAKHMPIGAALANFNQLITGAKEFKKDVEYYQANKEKMTPEQRGNFKDGLRKESLGLSIAAAGIGVGIGLAVAVAVGATIPGVNVAVASVAAAVVVGFIIYKVGHKINKEIKQEVKADIRIENTNKSKKVEKPVSEASPEEEKSKDKTEPTLNKPKKFKLD